ncbi:MAG: hypothetical protein JSW27_08755 [Phycisphaerales bacterium]|nr:MAG: hypothetical protein JSW27_08755 [Phycisphaerales bacterium]
MIGQEPVKRLHVCLWWGELGSRNVRDEKRLDWLEFKALNDSHQLCADVDYRLTNRAKYRR